MKLSGTYSRTGGVFRLYGRFERIVSAVLVAFVSVIILYSVGVLAITLYKEFAAGALVEVEALKDTFGLILTILILVEFNHSIAFALHRRMGVLQVRVIVLITIIVIARKLILLDYAKTDLDTLLGLGGLALALGLLYWLLSHAAAPPFAAGTADRESESG